MACVLWRLLWMWLSMMERVIGLGHQRRMLTIVRRGRVESGVGTRLGS